MIHRKLSNNISFEISRSFDNKFIRIDLFNEKELFSYFALIIDGNKFDLIVFGKFIIDQL